MIPDDIRVTPRMRSYTFFVTLQDSGLPFSSYTEAKAAADEWAKDLAKGENCMVGNVVVTEDVVEGSNNECR